ncbi:MAG: hypothetical protein WBW75_16740 [Mycobacterium sp.]|uniref:hypothetical protein n=1 Tax=Mycobacterium sp. TaxID=1785 RepID=UPI003C406E0E
MNQDDPEKRIAELEHQLAERMRGADLPPALPRTWVSVDGGGFFRRSAPPGTKPGLAANGRGARSAGPVLSTSRRSS